MCCVFFAQCDHGRMADGERRIDRRRAVHRRTPVGVRGVCGRRSTAVVDRRSRGLRCRGRAPWMLSMCAIFEVAQCQTDTVVTSHGLQSGTGDSPSDVVMNSEVCVDCFLDQSAIPRSREHPGLWRSVQASSWQYPLLAAAIIVALSLLCTLLNEALFRYCGCFRCDGDPTSPQVSSGTGDNELPAENQRRTQAQQDPEVSRRRENQP